MATKHYYGFYNIDGNRTRHADDGKRIGILHIFASKKARDQWVDDDVFDNDWHREAVTAAEARFDLSYELKHAAEELPSYTHIDYGETLTLSDLTQENSKYACMNFYVIHK